MWHKPLPGFLVDVLADHMKRFPHDDFVFTTLHGQLVRKGTFYRVWHQALREAGLERITPHALRHTCSSLLDEKGVSVKERMDYVGHSTVAMQMHYTHTGTERLKSVAAKFDVGVRERFKPQALTADDRNWPMEHRIVVRPVRKVTSER